MVFALAFWSLICTISNQACEGAGGPLSAHSDNSAYLWLLCIRRDDGDARGGQRQGREAGVQALQLPRARRTCVL